MFFIKVARINGCSWIKYTLKDNDENIKISFSARYMMEALKSFTGTHVELSFVGEVKPIIIKDKDEDELTQLVLPIRTY